MKYNKIIEEIFIKKINRFVPQVDRRSSYEKYGRLTELLYEGAKVYLDVSNNPKRKSKYFL